MEKKTRCIEVRTSTGQLIVTLHLVEREVEADKKQETPERRSAEQGKDRSQGGSGSNGEALMTDAQKRYLFRLLADQGKEKEEAYEHLKNEFGVQALKDVTKQDASRLISRLVEEG